jgi:hypothetical protein
MTMITLIVIGWYLTGCVPLVIVCLLADRAYKRRHYSRSSPSTKNYAGITALAGFAGPFTILLAMVCYFTWDEFQKPNT